MYVNSASRPASPFACDFGANAVVWSELHVPTDAAPGEYSGHVEVTVSGKPAAAIPVRVTVWPVTMLFLFKRCGLGRHGLLRVLGVLFLLSAATALVASPEVAYFATWTRASEIFAGALLGAWMSTSSRPTWPSATTVCGN